MNFHYSLKNIVLLAALSIAGNQAQASVAYNTNGWNSGDFPGASGFVPGTWIGSAGPAYTGSLNTVWYADLSSGSTDVVSTENAISAGADPLYQLAVGPMGWQRPPAAAYPNQGMGHGADIGLIKLDSTSNLTITVSADSTTPADPTTVIIPGFSLFQGWDTGSTANQVQAYYNNQNNPLGTVGLTYLNGGGSIGTSFTLAFGQLSAGDYTLILGGNAAGGHGAYSVSFDTSPVPVPASVWLFFSALLGMGAFGKRKPV